jgi:hypothetical protein
MITLFFANGVRLRLFAMFHCTMQGYSELWTCTETVTNDLEGGLLSSSVTFIWVT